MCLQGQGVGNRCLGTGSVLTVCRGPSAALLWAKSPPDQRPEHRKGRGQSSSPCTSHWVCFLNRQLLSRGSPMTHHTLSWVGAPASCPLWEGDTQCPLLLKTQTKAWPLPCQPWEPSQGLRGVWAQTCLYYDPPLVYLLCSLGPRGASGPHDSKAPRQGVAVDRGLPQRMKSEKQGKRPPRVEEWGDIVVGIIVSFPTTPFSGWRLRPRES